MGKVIAFTNQKGGVGKTTTTVNLAASLALAEKKVLVIDFDPQGNASSNLGIDKTSAAEKPSVYDALIGRASLKETIRSTEMEHLFVAPCTQDLAGAEIELVSAFAREAKLKAAISEIKAEYDYIFIDCPPSLGLLTVNALNAADSFMVPLQCEFFALEGLSQLMNTVGLIRQSINPFLNQEGVILTMFDKRNNLAHEVVKEVRTHFGTLVYETTIPRNVRLSECSSFGKPVLLYDINSTGCLAYLNLAKEFLNRNGALTPEAQAEHHAGRASRLASAEDATAEGVIDAAQERAEGAISPRTLTTEVLVPPPFNKEFDQAQIQKISGDLG